MRYEQFDGEKTYVISVKGEAELKSSYVSNGGSLSCSVTDQNGDELYRSDNVTTGQASVFLPQKGKYYVTLKAKNHSGSFEFSIEK